VVLIDLKQKQEVRRLAHDAPIQAVPFSANGKQAFSACGVLDRSKQKEGIRMWEVQTGKQVRNFLGHEGAVTCLSLTRDGKQMLSGSADKTLRLWDLQSGKEIRRLEGHKGLIVSVTLSPDGRLAVSTATGNQEISSLSTLGCDDRQGIKSLPTTKSES
jgi:WD40 repeat protein